ncbi:hypothetical protein [Thioalkalivibrio sp. XN279]|uniref:hypothetical protein n=1 Tax=Thioalkalivibrio sp. XN279 TaxID=2714953 RepID=UPI001408C01E|nr:hypothetical protein [Thioalkalivibrio sp. XN279]NHA15363.1 hypothetical protein [Thioalkalivibrio sp. XN279]
MDKASVTALVALVLCFTLVKRTQKKPTINGRAKRSALGPEGNSRSSKAPGLSNGATGTRVFFIFFLAVLLSPFLTVLQNGDSVMAGPRFIAGLRPYDGVSMSVNLFIALVPFLLGMRFLAAVDQHRYLVTALAISGALYAFLVLFEVRMSPRLHIWIYGFFQHSWVQHIRGGGFRPIVFLEHGLAVGLFLATAMVAASERWREAAKTRFGRFPWVVTTLWIGLALFLSRNLAAEMLALLFLPVVLLFKVRKQMLVSALVALTFLTFPLLRGADLFPIETIVNVAAEIDPRRAESLQFRFGHEDALFARAQEKPLVGWGGWGRNRLYDERTGADLSVTDGAWVIVIGTYGWFGYIAQFGLMALPLLMIWRLERRSPGSVEPATAALAMIMALSLIYLIPNDFRNPIFWLVAGALAGRYQHAVAHEGRPKAETRGSISRRPGVHPHRMP